MVTKTSLSSVVGVETTTISVLPSATVYEGLSNCRTSAGEREREREREFKQYFRGFWAHVCCQ